MLSNELPKFIFNRRLNNNLDQSENEEEKREHSIQQQDEVSNHIELQVKEDNDYDFDFKSISHTSNYKEEEWNEAKKIQNVSEIVISENKQKESEYEYQIPKIEEYSNALTPMVEQNNEQLENKNEEVKDEENFSTK